MDPRPWLLFFCAAVLVGLSGCGGHKPFVWQEPAERVVWPPPPEVPRLRYLHSFARPADLRDEPGQGERVLRWLLGKTSVDLPLATPYAVAMDGDDALWIADNGSRMLYRYDLPRGKVDYIREAGGVALLSPIGLAVDQARGRLLVSDSELGEILVLDLRGRLLSRWTPPGGFGRPGGVALDSAGRLYVADVIRRQVFVFDPAGAVIAERDSRLEEGGRFGRPVAVAVGPRDELLILDAGTFRIEVQDSRGDLLGTIGKLGDVPGTFARPRGVAVSAQGLVLVSDAAFDNIQVFDLTGRLLLYFGTPGVGVGQFSLPAGLCFDDEGRVFVADAFNRRVQAFEFLSPGR
jgi:DNA-binding beta-propeller fold protein YncE